MTEVQKAKLKEYEEQGVWTLSDYHYLRYKKLNALRQKELEEKIREEQEKFNGDKGNG